MTLRRLAVELVAEIRHLDRRVEVTNTQIAEHASGRTPTDLRGIGVLTAAKILAVSVMFIGSTRLQRSPPTPAPRRSKSPPATPCVTGYRALAT